MPLQGTMADPSSLIPSPVGVAPSGPEYSAPRLGLKDLASTWPRSPVGRTAVFVLLGIGFDAGRCAPAGDDFVGGHIKIELCRVR